MKGQNRTSIKSGTDDIWGDVVEVDLLFTDVLVGALRAMQLEDPPEWAKLTVLDCAAKGRLDVLESAVKVIRHEPKELAMHVARFVARTLSAGGEEPSKGDVLEVMEAFTPGLYHYVPKNKGERAKWWKRSGLHGLPKTSGVAGNVPDSVRHALEQIERVHTERAKRRQ